MLEINLRATFDRTKMDYVVTAKNANGAYTMRVPQYLVAEYDSLVPALQTVIHHFCAQENLSRPVK